uniref:Uncharacterized protein n=1 Tax=Rangifer tarandus platyrhynchus TaxID=3082113 RepID=A0ACB0EM80_RANTA|nr:unnamed protein product [Rangifer tarandus platyrhynchus]
MLKPAHLEPARCKGSAHGEGPASSKRGPASLNWRTPRTAETRAEGESSPPRIGQFTALAFKITESSDTTQTVCHCWSFFRLSSPCWGPEERCGSGGWSRWHNAAVRITAQSRAECALASANRRNGSPLLTIPGVAHPLSRRTVRLQGDDVCQRILKQQNALRPVK